VPLHFIFYLSTAYNYIGAFVKVMTYNVSRSKYMSIIIQSVKI